MSEKCLNCERLEERVSRGFEMVVERDNLQTEGELNMNQVPTGGEMKKKIWCWKHWVFRDKDGVCQSCWADEYVKPVKEENGPHV